MAQVTLREALEDAGVRHVNVEHDDDGVRYDGWFEGPAADLEQRVDADLELKCLEAPDEPTFVVARPKN